MEKELIIGDANEMDWELHSSLHEIQNEKDVNKDNAVLNELKPGSSFMVVRNYKDGDEYEYCVIEKLEDKYRFITDTNK